MNNEDVIIMAWQEVHDAFIKKGHIAIYGGGTKSKGHGFWIYPAPAEAIQRYKETRGWTHMDDFLPAIQNDGKLSGNPFFWMMPEARKLLASL